MLYGKGIRGRFLRRPNRFTAWVEVEGQPVLCHVKNTGRCRELLSEGSWVCLQKADRAGRATLYDLVAVYKGDRLVNIDSQAPNKVVGEWLEAGGLGEYFLLQREKACGGSRLDFYMERPNGRQVWIEVKGVTLEEGGRMLFPDAPSERAIRHLGHLEALAGAGHEAYVLFVIQMEGALVFLPNALAHRDFALALYRAARAGVGVLAYGCRVREEELAIDRPLPVLLPIEEPLLEWYDAHKRDLPWRRQPQPYNTWVSEIMLQQTRVEAVLPYYTRFMEAAPTVEALAALPQEKLMKLWEGLGYYRRAKNLHRAAGMVAESGRWPDSPQAWRELPGVGEYTAGAICSIAMGMREPAVDGNAMRVFARLAAYSRPIDQEAARVFVRALVRALLPRDRAGDFNQALMDLAGELCKPGQPLCGSCPLAFSCNAHRAGLEAQLPGKSPKKARKVERKTILAVLCRGKLALEYSGQGLLSGLYGLPSLAGHVGLKELAAVLEREFGLAPGEARVSALPEAKHIFTHREWHMWGYLLELDALPAVLPPSWTWAGLEDMEEAYALPSAYKPYKQALEDRIRRGQTVED